MWFVPRKEGVVVAGFVAWLPVAVAVTGCALIAFGASRQIIRLDANEEADAMAEQAADALTSGQPMPAQPEQTVDVASSLTPFIAYYDAAGAPLASSGLLEGRIPVPPAGMLAEARRLGENRVTWQPSEGVRIAAVVAPVAPGREAAYVLAGRSLREAEREIAAIGGDVAFGWAVTMLASFAASCFAARRKAA